MKLQRYFVFACMLILSFPAGAVLCHTFPHHSEPGAGEVLTVSPQRIGIWFDGALERAFSTIRVQNEKGQQVDNGDAHLGSSDKTHVEVTLPPLSPGIYRVFWNVVSRDGHRVQGDYTFTLR